MVGRFYPWALSSSYVVAVAWQEFQGEKFSWLAHVIEKDTIVFIQISFRE